MLVDSPALVVAEVVENEPGLLEGAVAVGQRDVDPGVAEADDVGAAVAGDVGDEAGVPVDLPAAGLGAEVVDGRHGRVGEGAVSVGEGDVDAGVAEADDVGAAVAGEVGEEAGVLVDAPALVVAEVVGENWVVGRCRRRWTGAT